MTELHQRLGRCFCLVFPDLRGPEVYSASVASLAAWDSMTMIVLVSVIEEEFHVKVAYEDLPDLVSFELFLDYLGNKIHAAS
jgi:hypothetical protein